MDVHDPRAVAVDIDNLFIGAGDFGAEGGGIAEAHRAEAERADVAARLVEAVELRGPHLVLADAGRDDRVAFGEFVERLNGFLRDDVFALFVAEGVILHPCGDLRVPRGVVGRGEGSGELVEAREGELDVAGDGELDAFVRNTLMYLERDSERTLLLDPVVRVD